LVFRYLDLLDTDFMLFLSLFGATVLALVLGIAFHEFSHAATATALGDTTAQRQGRLSLNPLVHLDPVGTVLLFLLGFGWGKPTPVNPYALRTGPRGMAIVAAAGPISNFVIATLLATPIRLGWVPWHNPFTVILDTTGWGSSDYLGLVLGAAVFLNVILGVFNLIPLAPLDGFKVALGILPPDLARPLARLEQYGMAILMILFFMPLVIGINPLGEIMVPAVEGITDALLGIA
jgi:Zn-dependent protease